MLLKSCATPPARRPTDCSGQWGSQHYGCVGLLGRAPEYNPKPAAAAFATMSLVLDLAEYDGFIETGSRSAYCLRFKDPDGARRVYPAWTLRGKRPLALSFTPGAKARVVDENGNAKALDTAVESTVELSPTPVWIVVEKGALEKAVSGKPVYEKAPTENIAVLEDFEKADWTYNPELYVPFESNHWDVVRETAPMKAARVESTERGSTSTVFRVSMAAIPLGKPMVGFYGVFAPPNPIATYRARPVRSAGWGAATRHGTGSCSSFRTPMGNTGVASERKTPGTATTLIRARTSTSTAGATWSFRCRAPCRPTTSARWTPSGGATPTATALSTCRCV